MPLTATAVQQAKTRDKSYKLSDEKGMFLLVQPDGRKYWRLKYRVGGKEKLLALGVYPDTSLKDARDKRDEARSLHAKGGDPATAKKAQKSATVIATRNSFKAIGNEWLEVHMADKSRIHKARTKAILQNDLYPWIGNEPITQIKAPDLLAVLRKIEARGVIETTHKAKRIAGQVFRFAVATGRAESDPSGALKGALRKSPKKHFAAITEPKQVGKLLIAIDCFEGTPVVKAALQLSALLFGRPGEIRQMEWDEISWEQERWEIPAQKMKMGQPHIVPLSSQALAILKELHRHTGHRGQYVFPSARGASRPLSDNGVRIALRTMGYDKATMTPHGFRAMARTILDEVLNFRIDWIEHQLAHAVKDTNGRAYNRTSHIVERTKMMQKWADYLDDLKAQTLAGNVITGKFGKVKPT